MACKTLATAGSLGPRFLLEPASGTLARTPGNSETLGLCEHWMQEMSSV